jgi:hypothetical protein
VGGGGGGGSCRSFEVGGRRSRRVPRGLHQAAPRSFQQVWRPISLPGPPVRLSNACPCSCFVYKGAKSEWACLNVLNLFEAM